MSEISTLKPQEAFEGMYLCKYKQILKNKNGKDYCSVKLQDCTGLIDGKIWNIHSGIEEFEVDDIVQAEGEVLLYQENLQLNITKLKKAPIENVDLKAFIPSSKKDSQLLEKQLFEWIDQIENPFLKTLLENIFYDEALYPIFICHSAAKSVHHAYLHGLLEHTVHVTKIGKALSEIYSPVEKDLVTTGCLLHDIGKIYELSSFPKNDYTDEGQLVGHLVLGAELIHDKVQGIKDFPKNLETILKHILLSHHGEYEYASPKRPKCIEAMIVHLADYSDARLKLLEEMLEGATMKDGYVGYNKLLNRNIRKVTL